MAFIDSSPSRDINIAMSAQILISRGRSLGKYRSTLPKLVAGRTATSPSCRFSTNPRFDSNGGGDGGDEPPRKRHPQSFVQSDIDLELGELETELPPGFHQEYHRKQRGMPKPRHHEDGRDSYWRPPWRNPRVEMVSEEDFRNRPRVTFSEGFASLRDAMITLSWMSQEDKDGMYALYVNMMTAIAEQDKAKKTARKDLTDDDWEVLATNTSHEYVVRVVAQKYNVTTSRAGGVIQLQHNEEQLKRDPAFKVQHALQAHVDQMVRENHRQIYKSYGEVDPLQFVEDVAVATNNVPSPDASSPVFVSASELMDVDARLKKTRLHELEDAKVRIDNHVYVEDVDERTRRVKVDREARQLLKMQEELVSLYDEMEKEEEEDSSEEGEAKEEEAPALAANDGDVEKEEEEEEDRLAVYKKKKSKRTKVPKLPPIPPAASPLPENGAGHKGVSGARRPRWKYVAQIIDTHAVENPPGSSRHGKVVARRTKGRKHGRVVDGNTVVEQGGKLRAASVAELEQTSWKHVRNESEFMFRGVKKAWMRRQLEGEVGGWGVQEEVNPPEQVEGGTKDEGADGDAKAEGEGEAEEADDKEGGDAVEEKGEDTKDKE